MLQCLRQFRRRRNLTQIELGEILDMEQGTISNLENGRRRLDATKVKKVSELTGIPKHELRPDLYEEGE